MRIILASASPRRRELLAQAGVVFEVRPADADERIAPGTAPNEAALALACKKAALVAQEEPLACVVAADTIVAIDGEILGKPSDEQDAVRMLLRLSGRTHSVFTGVCLQQGARVRAFAQETRVTFFSLSAAAAAGYVAVGESQDKAGAYGIQGRGALLVECIDGDYCNVVGLPIARLMRELAAFLGQETVQWA